MNSKDFIIREILAAGIALTPDELADRSRLDCCAVKGILRYLRKKGCVLRFKVERTYAYFVTAQGKEFLSREKKTVEVKTICLKK